MYDPKKDTVVVVGDSQTRDALVGMGLHEVALSVDETPQIYQPNRAERRGSKNQHDWEKKRF